MVEAPEFSVPPSPGMMAVAIIAIFVVAFGVRLLSWHDSRIEAARVQSGVAADYQRAASLFRQNGLSGFIDPSGLLADPNLLGHPPGYPIVRAVVATIFGDSNTAIQFFQITSDAIAAVLVFLIAIKLLPFGVGLIAGLLVAFSPQFAWNSVLLLPDTLAVVPLLLAIYFLAGALTEPRLVKFLLVGCFVGLSCWLRANALLLAPFLAVLVFCLHRRRERLRPAGVFLAGALLVIAPLTIRNWIVHHHFIPVSLGAGQTMLEGIADYDAARRFGIPDTDMGIMKMEAEQFNRPDYYGTLFAPDGIKRERLRLARGAKIAATHPVWFLSVMIRRAGSMLRLERARLVAAGPAVTHQFSCLNEAQLTWRGQPSELLAQAFEKSPQAELHVLPDGQALRLQSDESSYGNQFKIGPVAIKPDHDYLVRIPTVVESGRMSFNVAGAPTGKVYASSIVEEAEVKTGQAPPLQMVDIPFVSGSESSIKVELNNAAPTTRSFIHISAVELYELGPAALLWTQYPRIAIRTIQRLFITAVMLPLALLGIVFLVRRRSWRTLTLLLAVPAYYLCFQSALHTEYRYVLALHYFFFVFVAVAVHQVWWVALIHTRTRHQKAQVN